VTDADTHAHTHQPEPGAVKAMFQEQGLCGEFAPDGQRVCILPADDGHERHGFDNQMPRRFVLDRVEDMTGVSGTGIVAWGVQFPDGSVAIRWNTKWTSTACYASMDHVANVHLHHGATQIVWLDLDE
jgi:hypothetical protein